MRKYILSLILLSVCIFKLYAEDVTFVTNAPSATVVGAQVKLQYILKGGQGGTPTIPNEIKGFDILYGPSISSMTSMSIINGKTTSESNTTFSYTLMANQQGTFTLPAASIKVNGRNYTSNTIQIKVLPPDKNAQPQQAGSQPQAITSESTANNIKPDDAFVRAIFSKTKVNEQEAVVVTFRFYSVLQIRNVGQIEFPEFNGFMSEEFDLPTNRQLTLEHYNGRNYYVVDVKKSLLFPQHSGKITIPSGKLEFVFEVKSGKRIQTFFGSQDLMTEVKKVLHTNPVTVDVSPLPTENRPSNFSGGAGTFTISSDITNTEIKANDAVTIKLTITGNGNMKLIKNPDVKLPKDFEVYDPKVNYNLSLTNKGLSGTKTIEYLFIPRHPGKYTIPPIEFSYYDLQTKSYKTLKTEEYTLDVAKDPNAGTSTGTSYMNKHSVEAEQDIRYLKNNDYKFVNPSDFQTDSITYYLWYIIPSILFIVFSIVYRKQIKANADIAMMKTKKANKVASKRLKLAKKYLDTHDKDKFYDEVLRAVWGYLSDKLLIPTADLSRENVEIKLINQNVDELLIKQYIHIIDTCEFARYAPSESNEAMDKLYDETIDAIGKMENTLKPKK